MKLNYAGEEFETKFVMVGKENGCVKCKNLKSFLTNAMEGRYDNQITQVMLEKDEKMYDVLVAETGAFSLPIFIDVENNKFITGFDVPEILEILGE